MANKSYMDTDSLFIIWLMKLSTYTQFSPGLFSSIVLLMQPWLGVFPGKMAIFHYYTQSASSKPLRNWKKVYPLSDNTSDMRSPGSQINFHVDNGKAGIYNLKVAILGEKGHFSRIRDQRMANTCHMDFSYETNSLLWYDRWDYPPLPYFLLEYSAL